jgi:hypothetical protein
MQNGTTVPVVRSVSNSGRVVNLVPVGPLLPNTQYSYTVSEVRDTAGNIMSGSQSFSFTTGPTGDLVTPKWLAQPSAASGRPLPANTNVNFTFNEPISLPSLSGELNVTRELDRVAFKVIAGERGFRFELLDTPYPGSSYTFSFSASDLAGNPVSGNVQLRFRTDLDQTPPSLVRTSPTNQMTTVPLNARIELLFSESIDTSRLTDASVRLKAGQTIVPARLTTNAVAWDQPVDTLFITPLQALAANTAYTVEIDPVADLAGNLSQSASFSFTSGSALQDVFSGTIVSVTPTGDSVSPASIVRIEFSKPVSPASVSDQNVQLKVSVNSLGTALPSTLTVSGNVVTVTPLVPMPANRFVSVNTSGVRDMVGTLFTSSGAGFRTGGSTDNVKPTVLSTLPANGATNVPAAGYVSIQFSEPVWFPYDPFTGSTGSIQVTGNNVVIMAPAFSADSRTVTFRYETPGFTTVTVRIPSSMTDLSGNSIIPVEFSFVTGAKPDFGVPFISSWSPAAQTTATADASIILGSTKPLDPTSINEGVMVAQNGVLINGTRSLLSATQLLFQPASPFSPGAIVDVFVTEKLRSASGVSFLPVSIWFRVAGSTPEPLSLISRYPQPSSDEATSTLEAEFDGELDPASLRAVVYSQNGPVEGTFEVAGSVLRFTANETLAPGSYSLSLAPLRSASGRTSEPISLPFTVGRRAPAPAVLRDLREEDGRVRLDFESAINPVGLASKIETRDATGRLLPVQMQTSADRKTVWITGTGSLAPMSIELKATFRQKEGPSLRFLRRE